MKSRLREALTFLWTDSSRQAAGELHPPLNAPIYLKEIFDKVGKVTVNFDTFRKVLKDICKDQCTGFGFAVFDRDKKKPFAFILSTDFTGTIGGVTIPSSLDVYSPGDAPPGASLGSLACPVTAGSAILTTW